MQNGNRRNSKRYDKMSSYYSDLNAPKTKRKSQKRILVVDDDPAILESIQIILEGEGYEVCICESGSGLCTKISEINPNVIVLDYWLPGEEDGGAIAKRIKSNINSQDIPIIMISASNAAEKIARDAGVDDFIEKPFDIDDLIGKVKKCIN